MNDIINYLNETSGINKVNLFTKNPTLSGIYFEYINDEGISSKSYVDFLIKIGEYDLYLEIKAGDKNDYDLNKTKLIGKGFENYIKNMENKKNYFWTN